MQRNMLLAEKAIVMEFRILQGTPVDKGEIRHLKNIRELLIEDSGV